jgi:hypothetical protein
MDAEFCERGTRSCEYKFAEFVILKNETDLKIGSHAFVGRLYEFFVPMR